MSNEETKQGQNVRNIELSSIANNVLAAVGMADVVRTTLGPRGLDKLLVDQLGNRVITNDGYTVLVSIKTNHPVSRLLVEIAERQQMSVGDGTTSAVIMAAEMLKEGYRIISEYNIHPTKIIGEIDEGLPIIQNYLKASAISISSLHDPLLFRVINTATSSKLDGKFIAELIAKAVDLLDKTERKDFRHGIVLLRRLGDDLFINGIALEHLPVDVSVLEGIKAPTICLVKDTLKLPLKDKEEDDRTQLISTFESSKINIIITNAPEIDQSLRLALTTRGIAIIRVSTEELELLSKALSLKWVYGIELLNNVSPPITQIDSIDINEDDELTILRSPKSGVVATLLIGGVTNETSKERMRTTTDGISAAHFAMEGGVVAGGGVAELNCAKYLQKYMAEKGIQKPGFDVLIKGLESISRQILDNSGYNGYEMALKIKGKPDGMGVDIDSGNFIDMVQHGIVDPLVTKISAINVAVHITKSILKIDRNLLKVEDKQDVSTS
ncbi:MAG: hypothetical protein JRN37_10095 [Nitrososphaerota archaeon]|jgi:chaperonin GroEL (HSP60 family)|nr:hypothetical protein [Nitrososphaerota archaeon]MDG7039478.1 hypothetical protein [Nitrososphaerota archaeon]MDG7040907.1 hypothetical protein [Nitrososphaerota archaeon]